MTAEFDSTYRDNLEDDERPVSDIRLRVFINRIDGVMKHMIYSRSGNARPRFLAIPSLCPEGEEMFDHLYDLALLNPPDENDNHVLFDGDPVMYQMRFLDRYSRPGQSVDFFRRQGDARWIDLYEDRDD